MALGYTVQDAVGLVEAAKRTGKKLVIGYILRHHPSWIKFIELAKTLGSPLVFRMNLNQQSSGKQWEDHKKLLQSLSPIVDCGVHYLDVMCQITRAKAVKVHALGARLTDGMANVDLPNGMYNYGMLQVAFDDGSVGWYEAGWGPMMSETAFFVKDVIGPKGSVSIVVADEGSKDTKSADINTHTKTNRILLHHAALDAKGEPAKKDEVFDTQDEPDHDALCEREQRYLLKAIRENVDLSDHMSDAVRSLRIALAADRSVRTGEVVTL
jgi:predicted dehydrogenase